MKNEKQFKLSVEIAAKQLYVAYKVCEAPNGFHTVIEFPDGKYELMFKRIEPENPSEAHLKKLK